MSSSRVTVHESKVASRCCFFFFFLGIEMDFSERKGGKKRKKKCATAFLLSLNEYFSVEVM